MGRRNEIRRVRSSTTAAAAVVFSSTETPMHSFPCRWDCNDGLDFPIDFDVESKAQLSTKSRFVMGVPGAGFSWASFAEIIPPTVGIDRISISDGVTLWAGRDGSGEAGGDSSLPSDVSPNTAPPREIIFRIITAGGGANPTCTSCSEEE